MGSDEEGSRRNEDAQEMSAQQQVGDNRVTRSINKELNVPAYKSTDDTDNTAERWEQWSEHLVDKIEYHEVEQLNDRLKALKIYGGEEVRELLKYLPPVEDADVEVPNGEVLGDFQET